MDDGDGRYLVTGLLALWMEVREWAEPSLVSALLARAVSYRDCCSMRDVCFFGVDVYS